MNDRQRFLTILDYGQPDQPLLMQWMGFSWQTVLRWRKEGLPEDAWPGDWFGLSRLDSIPVTVFPYPVRDDILIEDGGSYRIVRNNRDLIVRLDENAPHFPHYMESPVKTRADWETYSRRINRGFEGRYDALRASTERYRNSERPVILGLRGCWEVRYFLGMTEALMMLHDDPGFITEMLDFWFGHQWEIIDRVCEYVIPDALCIWEDLAYKNGPFVSPAMYERTFARYHRGTADRMKKHGIRHLLVDCDGRIDQLLPLFLENGITGTFPLECQSDADPVKFRKRFGKTVQMIGGIDKRALIRGPEATKQEVEQKLARLVPDSGFIPGLDHAVPLEVPLDTFRYYIDVLRETWEKLLPR